MERGLDVQTDLPNGKTARVTLLTNADGDIVAAEAPDRPRDEPGGPVPRPWRGEFSDHGDIGGLRMPRKAEASWLLPDGPFVYWRAEITERETLD